MTAAEVSGRCAHIHGVYGLNVRPAVLPHVPAFFLAVTQEGPKMAGVDVCVYGDEEALVELKGTRELLGQLPHTLQELVDDRRHLFGISVQVSVPAGTPQYKLASESRSQNTRGRKRSTFYSDAFT